MEMGEIRRKNLREVVSARGGPTSAARLLGYANGAFLVQMCGPNPTRPVTEKTARAIERTLGLKTGYLDQLHTDEPVIKVSADLVHKVAHMVQSVQSELQVTLPPGKFADVVTLVYDNAKATGEPQRDFVATLIRPGPAPRGPSSLAHYRDHPEQWREAGLMSSTGRLVCLDAPSGVREQFLECLPLRAGLVIHDGD